MLKTRGGRNILLWSLVLLGLQIFRMVSTIKLRLKIDSTAWANDIHGTPRELPLSVNNAVMVFDNDTLLDIHAADAWYTAIPPGNGWVVLGPNKTSYAVSMYHQMHCINSMRYDLIMAKSGKRPNESDMGHALHCYNYIRQGLLCKADVTLEPSVIRLVHGQVAAIATGNGVAHVCRDWSQVRQFMERNYREMQEVWNRARRPPTAPSRNP